MKPLNWRELLFLVLLFVTVVFPNKWINVIDLLVVLIFFFNWKLIFQVMFLGYDPNTGKKKNPLEDIALERSNRETIKNIIRRRY